MLKVDAGPGDKGGRVRLSDAAFSNRLLVCVCGLVHVYLCMSLSIQTHVPCCSKINVSGFADLSATLHNVSRSSLQVSSENAAHSCGTRLISSVIKINEVLIAAVIYANDCGTQDEDFLSLHQSEGESGF